MELMRLAGRRARVAQDAVRAEEALEAADAHGIGVGRDAAPDDGSRGGETSILLDTAASLYPPVADPDLPSPARTNTNLRHYLAEAMETQPGFGAPAAVEPRWRSRLRRLVGGPPRQSDYNAAVLHVLHQLDHRSQVQERRIMTLEARLAAAEGRRSVEQP